MSRQRSYSSIGNGGTERLDQYVDEKTPSMYKDKPQVYLLSSLKSARSKSSRRYLGFAVVSIVFVVYWVGLFSSIRSILWPWLGGRSDPVSWDARRRAVRDAFILSWDGYEKYAWGQDTYHPISKKGGQMIEKGMGWIIVDALDTLMIMGLSSRLTHARDWIAHSLDLDQDQEVNTFETTIRILGGLLSAHYLSTTYPNLAPVSEKAHDRTGGEDLYLETAVNLAERLLRAFESPSGIPFAGVNLKTGQTIPALDFQGASSSAEASTLQLEFKYLAYLTGEKDYWEKVEKIMQVVDDNNVEDGLIPIYLLPTTGKFRGNNIRLGSRGDSYYEYLIKQYLQTSGQEPIYQELWNETLAGVHKHLVTYTSPSNFTIIAERPVGLQRKLYPKMDHLVCFMPGTIALSVTGGKTLREAKNSGKWTENEEKELRFAEELTKTCWAMYKVTATGLAPEIAHLNIHEPPHMESDGILEGPSLNPGAAENITADFVLREEDSHNLQRPETVESLFIMWRITGDVKYREWGWEMFQAFMKYSTAPGIAGSVSLRRANQIPPVLIDNMESFWLAETLKYFYLLFSPTDFIPLDSVVFNTEGHLFPRFKLARGLHTGWKRKPRNAAGRRGPHQQPIYLPNGGVLTPVGPGNAPLMQHGPAKMEARPFARPDQRGK